MRIFEQGQIVRVPFPYTDKTTRQHRPALVISRTAVGDRQTLLWVVMITSAENRGWPGDYDIGPAYRDIGLPARSVIRTSKIATVEMRHAEPVGKISSTLLERVAQTIAGILGR